METNTSATFIPKKTIVSNEMPGQKKSRSKGKKFQNFSVILFFLVIISYGGLIFYKSFISSSINDLKLELTLAEDSLDMESIDKILRFENKLNSGQELLNNHISVSSIFKMFEDSTVNSVQFTDFSMTAPRLKSASLFLKGRANSYSTIALQEKAFMDNQYTESVAFSNFDLSESGLVTFDFQGTFSPSVVSFREMIINSTENAVIETENPPVDGKENVNTESGFLDSNDSKIPLEASTTDINKTEQ